MVLDEEGRMLGARIAKDDQWRFSPLDSVPAKFKQCIIHFEDQHFEHHPGVNPVSIVKALKRNMEAGKVVSGGSTLTMQLVRLSRNNPSRTLSEKLFEMLLATRLEWSYSKKEILNMYASHAPFGGNTVGLEAAAWRYFSRSAWDLSWAEMATLAVLPNAPGLIHPGKNRDELRKKRDRLLKKLVEREVILQETYELALLEGIPDKPNPLLNIAPHLTDQLTAKEGKGSFTTTLNLDLQKKCMQSLMRFQEKLQANEVHNGSVLLIDAKTGAVKAYVGNHSSDNVPGRHNDMIQTPRSSGSILKPFLYCSMLNEGSLWPRQLVKDVPLLFADFKPENFVNAYAGAIPADEALAQSLNIPFVFMLKQYGIDHFLNDLKDWRFSTINRSAENYGLSLILGGAEVNSWELGNAYYSMFRTLNSYKKENYLEQSPSNIYVLKTDQEFDKVQEISKGAIYHSFKAMAEVVRPESELGWQLFEGAKVAWKTGTSFGHRDAWAVGVTPSYIAVVWIGNSSGEGRPGLVGAQAAGPVLFDLLNSLPIQGDFLEPHDDLRQAKVCSKSGYPAGPYCEAIDTIAVPDVSMIKERCPFHQKVFTDREKNYRLNQACANAGEMMESNWFVLPPSMAWFYKKKEVSYKALPPWHPKCNGRTSQIMELLYPKKGAKIFLPKDLGAKKQSVILEVTHQRANIKLYWHLNQEYMGTTEDFHQMQLDLTKGKYQLHVEDEEGNYVKGNFEIIEKN